MIEEDGEVCEVDGVGRSVVDVVRRGVAVDSLRGVVEIGVDEAGDGVRREDEERREEEVDIRLCALDNVLYIPHSIIYTRRCFAAPRLQSTHLTSSLRFLPLRSDTFPPGLDPFVHKSSICPIPHQHERHSQLLLHLLIPRFIIIKYHLLIRNTSFLMNRLKMIYLASRINLKRRQDRDSRKARRRIRRFQLPRNV